MLIYQRNKNCWNVFVVQNGMPLIIFLCGVQYLHNNNIYIRAHVKNLQSKGSKICGIQSSLYMLLK